ncbi:MAG TPA: hypothetical protein VEH31_24295 [Streptosporangiaceae bacterium]|nr:hypothetical protein [Streptosporangiaceae bacterium]
MGPPITSVGGRCANMAGEAADQDQLRAAVSERGADVVKIMVSGGFATAGTQVMLCQFTFGQWRGVVEEAHVGGLLVPGPRLPRSTIPDDPATSNLDSRETARGLSPVSGRAGFCW